jgi:Domain of unknown function (DUF3943)
LTGRELPPPARKALLLRKLIFVLFSCTALNAAAETVPREQDGPFAIAPLPVYADIGILYVSQWASYFLSQGANIRDNGSWENYKNNFGRVRLDKDSYDYNLLLHPVSGSVYYLYYRSRGYSKIHSVMFSFLASALFEFTIETFTERPSIQDIYQTPILGSFLGLGLEWCSLKLRNTDFFLTKALGYILNPFYLVQTRRDSENVTALSFRIPL